MIVYTWKHSQMGEPFSLQMLIVCPAYNINIYIYYIYISPSWDIDLYFDMSHDILIAIGSSHGFIMDQDHTGL
jgi:hypothetical protein